MSSTLLLVLGVWLIASFFLGVCARFGQVREARHAAWIESMSREIRVPIGR